MLAACEFYPGRVKPDCPVWNLRDEPNKASLKFKIYSVPSGGGFFGTLPLETGSGPCTAAEP